MPKGGIKKKTTITTESTTIVITSTEPVKIITEKVDE